MSKFAPVNKQMDLILRGTEEIIPVEELEKKLNYFTNIIKFINENFSKTFHVCFNQLGLWG